MGTIGNFDQWMFRQCINIEDAGKGVGPSQGNSVNGTIIILITKKPSCRNRLKGQVSHLN